MISHFTPGTTKGKAIFTTNRIKEIYEYKPKTYVYWMEMFYSHFNILKELIELDTKTSSDKATAIQYASSLIAPAT